MLFLLLSYKLCTTYLYMQLIVHLQYVYSIYSFLKSLLDFSFLLFFAVPGHHTLAR